MRKVNVIKGDIIFQWKYGFYGLYFLIVIIYLVIFSFFSGDVKNMIVSICVYSDPAAMGMFFMGALILLEKSQRITNSIAISPVTAEEYILGKVLSIGIISEIVGFVPVILYRVGFLWDNRLMLLHPGCAVMQLLTGNSKMALLSIISIAVWMILLFWIADMSVRKMFRVSGGAKL